MAPSCFIIQKVVVELYAIAIRLSIEWHKCKVNMLVGSRIQKTKSAARPFFCLNRNKYILKEFCAKVFARRNAVEWLLDAVVLGRISMSTY